MLTAKLKEKESYTEWRAQLDLEFSKSNNRTILSHRKHFGPLQVQKPFYPEINGTCHVYILHPPGGVVGGDRSKYKYRCKLKCTCANYNSGGGKVLPECWADGCTKTDN